MEHSLLKETKILVSKEKGLTLKILKNLRVIDEKRLYASLGCGSLFNYCVKILGYSEHEASNRINSMKLLQKSPKVEELLRKGELNLTQSSKIFSHLNKEENGNQSLNQILDQVAGLSTRKTEEILENLSQPLNFGMGMGGSLDNEVIPAPHNNKKEDKDNAKNGKKKNASLRPVMVSQRTLDKLEELRRLQQEESYSKVSDDEFIYSLIEQRLVDMRIARRKAKEARETRKAKKTKEPMEAIDKVDAKNPCGPIPQSVKDQVSQRANFRCEFVSKVTGNRCPEITFLQFEHVIPRAMGGPSSMENIKLFCRTCNQASAIRVFGMDKMRPYLRRASRAGGDPSGRS